MVRTVLNYKGYIVLVMILLLSQQSFAALLPMNCDDMKAVSIELTENNSHMSSTMHEHDSQIKDKLPSHEKCDVCDSGSCLCTTMGLCLGSSHVVASQLLYDDHILFIDLGNRFITSEESPDSGVSLHPFRPPISI